MPASRSRLRPLIAALDTENDREALALARRLRPQVDLVKVGPVLFLKYGGPFLTQLRRLDVEIFLDMKFHDIPSVVQKAIERARDWGVFSATVHTSGGLDMMRAAASVARRPRLWGVTVLTSLDQADLARLGIGRTVQAQVLHLAGLARTAGLDGVVSSVFEAAAVRRRCGAGFQIVTPGIRLAAAGDDQKRVQTPARALQAGAHFFVMGRPILEARDPAEAVREVYASLMAGARRRSG